MKKQKMGTGGISEAISVILVISLVVILAVVVYSMLFGTISLKPTSRVAATAGTATVPLGNSIPPMQIMDTYTLSGDPYYLKGQPNIPAITAHEPVASYILKDPNGVSHQVIPTSLSSNANVYGTPLFIYKGQNSVIRVTDNLASISNAPTQVFPFALGDYKITMVDNAADVILNIMDVKVTGNATPKGTVPSGPLLNVQPNSTWSMIGGVTNRTDPSGLTMYTFDGTSGYLRGLINLAQDFTGNLSLSLWMKPVTAGSTYSDTSDWHTIIGKGQLVGGVENDNYQLVQIGNKLYFEWTDAVTTTRYHIMTDTTPVQAGTMGYATVTVNAGVPAIYYNGVPQSISYYQSNYPTDTTTVPAVLVNMQNNNNDLLTGKQNGVGQEYYYKGDLSEVGLYNRAITTDEITHNLNYNQI